MSATKKVCVYVFEGKAACGRSIEPLDFAEHFGLEEFVARWSEWRGLPASAQCIGCVDHLGTPDGLRRRAGFESEPRSASRRDILSVSLFCAGLHGSLDATLLALLAQHLAGDDSASSIALDLAEERGYDTPGMLPVASVEWPRIERHEHAWLPWRSGEERRAVAALPFRRCTCGVFEHETRRGWPSTQEIAPARWWARDRLVDRIRTRMHGRPISDAEIGEAFIEGQRAADQTFDAMQVPRDAMPELHAEVASLSAMGTVGLRYRWSLDELTRIRVHQEAAQGQLRRTREVMLAFNPNLVAAAR